MAHSVNHNALAKKLTLKEGKKKNLNIADVKEVLKLVHEESHGYLDDILVLVRACDGKRTSRKALDKARQSLLTLVSASLL